jgi:hypothetical protein
MTNLLILGAHGQIARVAVSLWGIDIPQIRKNKSDTENLASTPAIGLRQSPLCSAFVAHF